MKAETRLIDLTAVHVPREMYRLEGDPLADPHFNRQISAPTTEDQRKNQAERLFSVRRVA